MADTGITHRIAKLKTEPSKTAGGFDPHPPLEVVNKPTEPPRPLVRPQPSLASRGPR